MKEIRFEEFLPYVYSACPHVPQPNAIIAVRNACIEFCKDTLYLQDALPPFDLDPEVAEYQLVYGGSHEIIKVVSLYYGDGQLAPVSSLVLNRRYGKDWRTVTGKPRGFTSINPSLITLFPMPLDAEEDAITGTVALAPKRSSEEVAEVLFTDYCEEIASGAVAKLAVTPNQAYTSPELAQYHRKLFQDAVGVARLDTNAGQVNGRLQVNLGRGW